LFQRVVSISHRPELTRLNQLIDEDEIPGLFAGWPQTGCRKPSLLPAHPRSPYLLKNNRWRRDLGEIYAPSRERIFATGKRTLANGVKYEVIPLTVIGKVFGGVINNLLGAQTLPHF
jgi:hypothetical protein